MPYLLGFQDRSLVTQCFFLAWPKTYNVDVGLEITNAHILKFPIRFFML